MGLGVPLQPLLLALVGLRTPGALLRMQVAPVGQAPREEESPEGPEENAKGAYRVAARSQRYSITA